MNPSRAGDGGPYALRQVSKETGELLDVPSEESIPVQVLDNGRDVRIWFADEVTVMVAGRSADTFSHWDIEGRSWWRVGEGEWHR